MPLTYVDAGVDQTKKDQAIDRILEMMTRTHDKGVIDLPWGFAGTLLARHLARLSRRR
jgi:phosphoribosylaminoimidazole (AIR) synthetase